jgi:hypothetical protein
MKTEIVALFQLGSEAYHSAGVVTKIEKVIINVVKCAHIAFSQSNGYITI